MTRKKQRVVLAREIRRLTGFKLPASMAVARAQRGEGPRSDSVLEFEVLLETLGAVREDEGVNNPLFFGDGSYEGASGWSHWEFRGHKFLVVFDPDGHSVSAPPRCARRV